MQYCQRSNGISKILQFFEDFSVEGLLRNGIDALLGLVGLKSCNKKNEKDKYGVCKYKLGYGPVFQDEPDLKVLLIMPILLKQYQRQQRLLVSH